MNNESPRPLVLGFAAYSGTGKTTMLKQVIPLLTSEGVRIAIIKHSHHDFSIDKPGKDSYELHHAGSQQTLLTSKFRSALITENIHQKEPELNKALLRLDLDQVDLVLVEGFRHAKGLLKIELHRPSLGKPMLLEDDKQIIAVASDENLQTHLPVLDINRPEQITAFIRQTINDRYNSTT